MSQIFITLLLVSFIAGCNSSNSNNNANSNQTSNTQSKTEEQKPNSVQISGSNPKYAQNTNWADIKSAFAFRDPVASTANNTLTIVLTNFPVESPSEYSPYVNGYFKKASHIKNGEASIDLTLLDQKNITVGKYNVGDKGELYDKFKISMEDYCYIYVPPYSADNNIRLNQGEVEITSLTDKRVKGKFNLKSEGNQPLAAAGDFDCPIGEVSAKINKLEP
jgi:hypothetical protein